MSNFNLNKHKKTVSDTLAYTLFDLAILEINKLRWHLEDSDLEETLRYFFSDVRVVQAYMLPKSVGSKAEREPQQAGLSVMPIDQAISAAVTASATIADPGERQAVYAAALMSPCGVFLADHPVMRLELGEEPLTEFRSSLKQVVSERPLSWLQSQSQVKGRLMHYLLDLPGQDRVVPGTWLYMRQSLQRGQVQIQCIW